MSSLQRLTEIGKTDFGLSGKELCDWVAKEREREDRERERERVHAIELAELEARKAIELAKVGFQAAQVKANVKDRVVRFTPKLLPFDESREEFESYLLRFERLALAQSWPEEVYAPNLSECLTGEALEVYARLSTEDALNYKALRNALCERCQITEEGYKRKFRRERPKKGESYTQFLARLTHYFDRWVELGDVEGSFAKLRDLLIREQFANMCNWENKDVTMFVKEHNYQSAKEMAELADKYVGAHGWRQMSKHKNVSGEASKTSQNNGNKSYAGTDQTKQTATNVSCFYCKESGHKRAECPQLQRKLRRDHHRPIRAMAAVTASDKSEIAPKEDARELSLAQACMVVKKLIEESTDQQVKLADGTSIPVVSALCTDEVPNTRELVEVASSKMNVVQGYLGDTVVSTMRDGGCTGVIVRRNLVKDEQLTGKYRHCVLIDGTVRKPPEAIIDVDSPYYTGRVRALCFKDPVYDVILGNIEGVRDAKNPDLNWKPRCAQSLLKQQSFVGKTKKSELGLAVETRGQKRRKEKPLAPLRTSKSVIKDVTVDQLEKMQQEDASLVSCRRKAQCPDTVGGQSGMPKFTMKRGLLYRLVTLKGRTLTQLVVPTDCREEIMRLGHDSIMAGHLGVKKTLDGVSTDFYWPGIGADVKRYCQSCDVCQKTTSKGKVTKMPLGQMPLIDIPFRRVAVDIVGPIVPLTERKNRYILTLVDYATRFPEAVPLPSIETVRVAEALVDIFSRIGVPSEVLTDMGAQFTSDLMNEVSRMLSIKQLTTTPYHPMCNGLVERFNGTLKLMLKRMCREKPKDWDRYVNPLLFAYREVPQASTGFAPFELLYGRTVRGPLAILKELWTKEVPDPEVKNTYQYVFDLRERLEETCKIAQEELKLASKKYKTYYDAKARKRNLRVGDKVLLLLPTDNNKLLMQWKGPFEIVEKLNSLDYRIVVGGKTKTFHANLLKLYVERHTKHQRIGQNDALDEGKMDSTAVMGCGVIVEDEYDRNSPITFPALIAKETVRDVVVCEGLKVCKVAEVIDLLNQFEATFTDLPGRTNLIECDMKLNTATPIRVKPYPVPFAMRSTLSDEIKNMMAMGVIEPSDSPFCSPLVMVKKPDGSNRSCIDFRRLNQACVFNAEPMPNADEIFAQLTSDKYFTKIDLCKGYWQIPMAQEAKKFTAFGTPDGLFQFTVMPFGLVTAPAIFTQMMRKLLSGLKHVHNYIDDILIHTQTWDEHVQVVRSVLQRLQDAGIAARPSKCFFGFPDVEFLGHKVGDGKIEPCENTLTKVEQATRPTTKKQVQSFLGLTGYYRDFIPNYAAIAVPLTDLVRKNTPNKIPWGSSQEKAFTYLKKMVDNPPILRLPDFAKVFYLRTDASNDALGAVLLQEHEGELFPNKYASRKLQPREKNYSVTERECLAIVWGIRKFYIYLYGREFILQTDHQSLTYLNTAKLTNSRVLRWALSLQDFKLRVHSIKGSMNVGADYLSRVY
jgi:hypothetical protein